MSVTDHVTFAIPMLYNSRFINVNDTNVLEVSLDGNKIIA